MARSPASMRRQLTNAEHSIRPAYYVGAVPSHTASVSSDCVTGWGAASASRQRMVCWMRLSGIGSSVG